MSHQQTTAITNISESWAYTIWGSGIGLSGLVTADIDNDGTVEVLAGGSKLTFGANDFWHVLEFSPDTQAYELQWTSNLYSGKISQISAFDTNNDGIYSIFVGLNDGDVLIHNGNTLEETGILKATGTVNQIIFADIDNDSINEIIIGYSDRLLVYNANSLVLEHEISYGASDFRVGNVDADTANEIVLSSGLVLEFNGLETTVEWNYGTAFGISIELSDIDSDGMDEIIGAASWDYVTAFDADLQSPKWQINADSEIDALLLADTDNDGVDEIIYGDGQWGEIHAHDAVTLVEEWYIDNPEHGVTNIALFDTDGDGDLEVLWGAGASSTGEDHLYVHDVNTQALEWQSQHIDGPFYATDVGDVDGDGQSELLFASFESGSGYDDGAVFSYDAQTHDLEWQSSTNAFGGFAWTGIHDLEIGDVDDDGVQDIVVGTDRLYDGAIYVFDGVTKQLKQSYLYDEGAPIYSLAIADVDNDGNTEIIAGGGQEHTGAPGTYVYIIDGSTGEVEWNSINLGGYWSDITELEVANLDNDEALEIAAINDQLYIFDGVTHQQWRSAFTGVTSVDLYDINGNGTIEILVGTNQGQLIVLNGQTLQEELNLSISNSAIASLKAYDFDQNGSTELVFASAGSVQIYDLDQGTVLWQSEVLDTNIGQFNSLEVANFDADPTAEILVGTPYQVVEFEITESQPILVQPLEDIIIDSAAEFALNLAEHFSDPDAYDALIYSAVGLPPGIILNEHTGLLSGIATDSGFYSIAVTATDMSGLSISDTFALMVQNEADQAPSNLQLQLSSKTATNVPVNLSGSFIDPDLIDSHKVTIRWGDGTANSVINLSSGNTNISSSHRYQNPGNYTISVTVADDIGQVQSSRSVQVGNANFSDFNRDNLSDIVWRNRVTGQNSLWFLSVNNQQISGESLLSVPNPAWAIEGIGDYDGDGQDDLVWRNETTGQNSVWLMDEAQRAGSVALDKVTGAGWQIQGVGSFQTNSIVGSDLIWRNQITGQNVIWRMDGTSRVGAIQLDTVTNPAWEIVGAGDFDGDGQNNDLVWRNYADGRNVIWFVNPDGTKSTQALEGLANTNWRIEGVSDFDGDGQKNDLLWRNEVTGQTSVWLIGSDFLQQDVQAILPQVANTNWSVVV